MAQDKGKKRRRGIVGDDGEPAQRHCGSCGIAGHNARACQVEKEESDRSSSLPDFPSGFFD